MKTIIKKTRIIINSAIICPLCGNLWAKVLKGLGCCSACVRKHLDEVIGGER